MEARLGPDNKKAKKKGISQLFKLRRKSKSNTKDANSEADVSAVTLVNEDSIVVTNVVDRKVPINPVSSQDSTIMESSRRVTKKMIPSTSPPGDVIVPAKEKKAMHDPGSLKIDTFTSPISPRIKSKKSNPVLHHRISKEWLDSPVSTRSTELEDFMTHLNDSLVSLDLNRETVQADAVGESSQLNLNDRSFAENPGEKAEVKRSERVRKHKDDSKSANRASMPFKLSPIAKMNESLVPFGEHDKTPAQQFELPQFSNASPVQGREDATIEPISSFDEEDDKPLALFQRNSRPSSPTNMYRVTSPIPDKLNSSLEKSIRRSQSNTPPPLNMKPEPQRRSPTSMYPPKINTDLKMIRTSSAPSVKSPREASRLRSRSTGIIPSSPNASSPQETAGQLSGNKMQQAVDSAPSPVMLKRSDNPKVVHHNAPVNMPRGALDPAPPVSVHDAKSPEPMSPLSPISPVALPRTQSERKALKLLGIVPSTMSSSVIAQRNETRSVAANLTSPSIPTEKKTQLEAPAAIQKMDVAMPVTRNHMNVSVRESKSPEPVSPLSQISSVARPKSLSEEKALKLLGIVPQSTASRSVRRIEPRSFSSHPIPSAPVSKKVDPVKHSMGKDSVLSPTTTIPIRDSKSPEPVSPLSPLDRPQARSERKAMKVLGLMPSHPTPAPAQRLEIQVPVVPYESDYGYHNPYPTAFVPPALVGYAQQQAPHRTVNQRYSMPVSPTYQQIQVANTIRHLPTVTPQPMHQRGLQATVYSQDGESRSGARPPPMSRNVHAIPSDQARNRVPHALQRQTVHVPYHVVANQPPMVRSYTNPLPLPFNQDLGRFPNAAKPAYHARQEQQPVVERTTILPSPDADLKAQQRRMIYMKHLKRRSESNIMYNHLNQPSSSGPPSPGSNGNYHPQYASSNSSIQVQSGYPTYQHSEVSSYADSQHAHSKTSSGLERPTSVSIPSRHVSIVEMQKLYKK
jgi:hypothetical protein